ncbi:MAG: hypothetical protein JO002_04200 [Burkholderiaceae bacterium]|nr:hypothetical protein [Burkholderiaceae bacterium]
MSTITSHDSSAWRQQFRLTHTFHLRSGADDSLAGQLEATLKQARAQIDKWLIVRRAGRYEHSITIEGIGEESARALRKEFASLSSDIKVHVEHLVHFEREAAY